MDYYQVQLENNILKDIVHKFGKLNYFGLGKQNPFRLILLKKENNINLKSKDFKKIGGRQQVQLVNTYTEVNG